ncbi:Prophage CP4-57 integrase [Shimia thalassica]|uniref:Prophage CP4-57 integrase n=1 Tax=Shimia thalassica TaxID=1715693 RepID=A0A0P1IKK5_9RHOB|nr:site-specific integrase [Shimia thalassica]CUK08410.1 Prophage CP4-57 integrase [Shimia thalassica]
MSRQIYKLTGTQVKHAPPGKHSDGGGLYLYVLATGKQWVFRFTMAGRRHEMGLGGYPETSLADARKQADRHRATVKAGGNPIEARKENEKAARAAYEATNPEARRARLLSTIAPLAFEARKSQLRDDGKAGRWYSPIRTHVLPKLGQKPVEEITGNEIAKALKPIWHSQPDVARKAITRLGVCLSHARAKGFEVDRMAVADAKELLGKQVHVAKHIESMDWQDVPAFYQSLEDAGATGWALQLLILTGLRSKPIRFAHVDQIEGDVWTVPADLVKGNKGKTEDFRVPVTSEALRVIDRARETARDGFLFPGIRKGVISDMTMAQLMSRRGLAARPHGFRSSFRTWADDMTNTPWEVKETAIGHKVGNKVSRAYLRTDYLEERRLLAQRWAQHVTGEQGQVLAIHGATA